MAQVPYGRGTGGYAATPRGGSPTHTEAWALTEAARRMAIAIAAYEEDASKDNLNKIRDAVRLNWRLWTIFQAELTTGNSSVPDNVRIDMLTLCKFVDNHTVEMLAETSAERVMQLIEINRNIASGLLEGLQKTLSSERAAAATPPSTPGAPPVPSVNEIS